MVDTFERMEQVRKITYYQVSDNHLILKSSLEISEPKITIHSPVSMQVFTHLKAPVGSLDSDWLAE